MAANRSLFVAVLICLILPAAGGPRLAAQPPTGLAPGDILIADYFAGPNGNGLLFWVNRTTGERRVLSDFDNPTQGPTGTSPYCVAVPDRDTIFVIDSFAFNGRGQLLRVDPQTGFRTVISDFANPAQGPLGVLPLCPQVINGELLVTDRDFGILERGALFRVNPVSGHRTLVSDFGDPSQGPLGESPHQISRGLGGTILVVDADAGTNRLGAVFRIDPVTGFRTTITDFGNSDQGPLGNNPGGVTQGAAGVLLVADTTAGMGETGELFIVNPLNGMRTVLSRFGDLTQGPTGIDPFHVTVAANGAILVVDPEGGTDIPNDGRPGGNGALFSVNRLTGNRTLLSDFGNATQGPTGVNPNGIAIVPMVQGGDVVIGAVTEGIGGILLGIDAITGARRIVSDFSTTAQGPTGISLYDVAIGAGGDLLVIDATGNGVFVVDPVNGARTLVSNVANAAQGPTGSVPRAVALGQNGEILVATQSFTAKLMSVDPATGQRTVVSDLRDPALGLLGFRPEDMEFRTPQDLLLVDADADSPTTGTRVGLLFSVDTTTGIRTLIHDFGDATKGPLGEEPGSLLIEPDGRILVADLTASPTVSFAGAVFRIDPATGARTVVTDMGNTSQGAGRSAREIAFLEDGRLLLLDNLFDSFGRGALFEVDSATGVRSIISNFRDTTQGLSIHNATGMSVFPTLLSTSAAPTADDGTFAVVEDTPAAGTLTASDPAGAPLTFSIVSNGSLGTAMVSNPLNGAFTYEPLPHAYGSDSFTFKVNNGTFDSNIATITVTIDPVNDAPVASDGALSVAAGGSANGTLGASDIDNDPLTFSIVSNGAKGTAVITNSATGAYTYTADAGASGSDTFTFKAHDGQLDSNTATIVVTITGGNQPPVASDAAFTTAEDKPVSSTLKATDPERAKLTFAIVSNGTLGTATVTNAGTGRFTYVPNPNVFGVDTFTFVANDGTLQSNVATVTVTINPVNDAPVASNLALDTTVNTPVSGQLPATDVDGDTLTFALGKGKGAKRGTVVISPDGQVTYTPNTGFTGTDSFTFQVSDGVASAPATVTVTVRQP